MGCSLTHKSRWRPIFSQRLHFGRSVVVFNHIFNAYNYQINKYIFYHEIINSTLLNNYKCGGYIPCCVTVNIDVVHGIGNVFIFNLCICINWLFLYWPWYRFDVNCIGPRPVGPRSNTADRESIRGQYRNNQLITPLLNNSTCVVYTTNIRPAKLVLFGPNHF
jgi:hypothetical protein